MSVTDCSGRSVRLHGQDGHHDHKFVGPSVELQRWAGGVDEITGLDQICVEFIEDFGKLCELVFPISDQPAPIEPARHLCLVEPKSSEWSRSGRTEAKYAIGAPG
jgi:hypothetical protein